MSSYQAGIPVKWPTWGITWRGQSHRGCPKNFDQRSQIYHQPDLGTILRLGIGNGSLQRGEYWSGMGDEEQRRKVERAWISV